MNHTLSTKRLLCETGRRMWRKGFGAGYDGNISARVGPDRVLCTPTGVLKGFLTPAMICEIDLQARPTRKSRYRATTEINLHLSIYRRRPDVRAVIHAHSPYATAFACAGVRLPEGVYPEADAMLGRVEMVEYFTPGDPKLGAAVAATIHDDTNTVLLSNHGTVSFGPTLEDAYCRLEVLEAYCRILLLLGQIGKAQPVSRRLMRELLEMKVRRGMPDRRLAQFQMLGEHNGPWQELLGRRGRKRG